jgi:hypothetical protein
MANVEIDGVNSKVYTDQVDPKTGTTLTLGTSGDTVSIPSGVTITNSGTDGGGFGINQTSFLPTAQPLIINGDMAIAQRTTSLASVSSGANWVTDRYSFNIGTAGTWTLTQEALTADEAFEDGFATAFKADNTTANGSLSAGSYIQFHQKIEAQDLQLLNSGESTAKKVTIAFWVKATKTGTNIIEIWVSDNSRAISVAYTVSSTNTWEKKIIDIPADTGGTGIDNNNGAGWTIIWWMAAGTDTTSGTLRTAWASNAVSADRAVGQVNNADSTSNNFHITGVQLEVGEYSSSDLPPFRHESYGDNLQRCERYYQVIAKGVDNAFLFNANNFDGTNIEGAYNYSPQMRAVPSIDQDTGTSYFEFRANNANAAFDSFNYMDNGSGQHALRFYSTGGGGSTSAGQGGSYRLGNASAGVAMDAEL